MCSLSWIRVLGGSGKGRQGGVKGQGLGFLPLVRHFEVSEVFKSNRLTDIETKCMVTKEIGGGGH